MDDVHFLRKLNEHAVRERLNKKLIERPDDDSYVDRWVSFMASCLRDGLALSDERWSRLVVRDSGPAIRFELAAGSPEEGRDADFRLGLQLLVGLLGTDKNDCRGPQHG